MLNKDVIIHKIEKAFSDVKLEEGIGLWEAQAIDDYASSKEQKIARQKDEKENWKIFTAEILNRCHSSLSFFDANSMRFHLPAFIISSLNSNVLDPLFHLTYLSTYTKKQLSTLNNVQREAIISYLEWCLDEKEYEFEHNDIQTALKLYWKNNT